MRILSLLPAATEIVYLLGLQKYLVGVSHGCDYPPEAKDKPKVTFSEVSNSMSSREIDERVKKMGHKGPARLAEDSLRLRLSGASGESRRGVFHIKEGVLKKLSPNLILTQELCEVCAIGFNQVKKAARILDRDVKIISLEPESVEDILENIRVVGEFGGKENKAVRVIRELRKRMEMVSSRLASARSNNNPWVLAIEWLDPIMVAGHWVPQMIKFAGGINLITKAGEKSKIVKLDQIISASVDILIISPCGFDIKRTIQEQLKIENLKLKVNAPKTYLFDGNAYMTRPGPRVIDGIEILAEILHPDVFKRKHSEKDWMEFMVLSR